MKKEERFRKIHFGNTGNRHLVVLYKGIPAFQISFVEAVSSAKIAAIGW